MALSFISINSRASRVNVSDNISVDEQGDLTSDSNKWESAWQVNPDDLTFSAEADRLNKKLVNSETAPLQLEGDQEATVSREVDFEQQEEDSDYTRWMCVYMKLEQEDYSYDVRGVSIMDMEENEPLITLGVEEQSNKNTLTLNVNGTKTKESKEFEDERDSLYIIRADVSADQNTQDRLRVYEIDNRGDSIVRIPSRISSLEEIIPMFDESFTTMQFARATGIRISTEGLSGVQSTRATFDTITITDNYKLVQSTYSPPIITFSTITDGMSIANDTLNVSGGNNQWTSEWNFGEGVDTTLFRQHDGFEDLQSPGIVFDSRDMLNVPLIQLAPIYRSFNLNLNRFPHTFFVGVVLGNMDDDTETRTITLRDDGFSDVIKLTIKYVEDENNDKQLTYMLEGRSTDPISVSVNENDFTYLVLFEINVYSSNRALVSVREYDFSDGSVNVQDDANNVIEKYEVQEYDNIGNIKISVPTNSITLIKDVTIADSFNKLNRIYNVD